MTDTRKEEDVPKRKWNILEKKNENWPVFMGDFEYVNQVLAEKSSTSVWLLLQYLNALSRSFGQVVFANNPVSGLLIMLAIGIADPLALLAGIYASTTSFVFALISKQDSWAILNGAFGYNPVLHGVATIGALPTIYPEINEFPPKLWLFLGVTSIISVYITSAFNHIFNSIGKYPVPCFTLPYNLVQFLLIFCLLHNTVPSRIVGDHLFIAPAAMANLSDVADVNASEEVLDVSNQTNFSNVSQHLNWGETFSGTIVALAQVYGLNNVICSTLMYVGLFVYSPMLAGFSYIGALTGTLLGVMFTSSHEQIYSGAWGYNGLLCSASLGGLCLVLNGQSTLIAFTSVVFSVALQHFLEPLFTAINLPVLTMPFNLTTILFLFITTEKEESLPRPTSISFPENHLKILREGRERPQQGYLRTSHVSDTKDIV